MLCDDCFPGSGCGRTSWKTQDDNWVPNAHHPRAAGLRREGRAGHRGMYPFYHNKNKYYFSDKQISDLQNTCTRSVTYYFIFSNSTCRDDPLPNTHAI